MLADHRFLTTKQLTGFGFADHASPATAARVCRRVLQRLDHLRLVERLGRRQGGVRAGSEATIWRLGGVGERILSLQAGQGARARRKPPSSRFLDHCLDIASAHLILLQAARHGSFELIAVTTEPASWRRYLGPAGEALILKPDLLATTSTPEFEDRWALEIDEGSESLPTLLSKCRQYEAYRRSGTEQHEHGVFPRVIWIVPDHHRADRLQTALSRARELDAELFRICRLEDLAAVVSGGAA